jgi:hypothetical protein
VERKPAPPSPSSIWATHREEFLSLLPFLWPKARAREMRSEQ